MSGKAGFSDEESTHGNALWEGVTTAFSWLSVVPLRGARVFDRTTGARAMAAIPLVGVLLGLVALALCWLLPIPSVTAVLIVVAWQLLARMMHLDGLADVGDALGSYRRREQAQHILRDPHTGAHGVGFIVLTLLGQFACLQALIGSSNRLAMALIAAAPVVSRIAGMVVCNRSFQPFSDTGFGALIIGTVRWWWIALWAAATVATIALLVAAGVLATGGSGGTQGLWISSFATCITLAAAFALSAHCSRRFGGVNGDCVGAVIEISTAVFLCLCALALQLPGISAGF